MRNHNKLPFKYLQSINCSKSKEKGSFMPSKSQSHRLCQRRLFGRNVTLIKCNKMGKNISCQTEICILMIGYKSKEFFSEHEDMSIPFKYCR